MTDEEESVQEWEDTSDSDEEHKSETDDEDDTDSMIKKRKRRKRRRRRRIMVSEDKALANLIGVTMQKHDSVIMRTTNNGNSSETLTNMYMENQTDRFDGMGPNNMDRWIYPMGMREERERIRGNTISDYLDLRSNEHYIPEDVMGDGETVDERVFNLTREADISRGLMSHRTAGVISPMIGSVSGYQESLANTSATVLNTTATSITDAMILDSINQSKSKKVQEKRHNDISVPMEAIDEFYSVEIGHESALSNVEFIMNSNNSPHKKDGKHREKFVKDLIESEFTANQTYRRWGTCQRPFAEHFQWLPAPLSPSGVDDFLREPLSEFGENACVRGDRCMGTMIPYLKSFPRTENDSTRQLGFVLREFNMEKKKIFVSDPLFPDPEENARDKIEEGEDVDDLYELFDEEVDDLAFEDGDKDSAKERKEKEEIRPSKEKMARSRNGEVTGSCILCSMWKTTVKVWQVVQTSSTWPYQIQNFQVIVGKNGYPKDRLLPQVLPKSGVATGIVAPTLAFNVEDYQLSTRKIRSLDGKHERIVRCYLQTVRHF